MADEKELSLQQQIQGLIKATADRMELKTAEQLQSIILSVETINARIDTMAGKKDVELVGQLKKDVDQLNENLRKNQEFFDNFIADQGKRKVDDKKDFTSAWNDVVNENIFGKKEEEIVKMVNSKKFEMKMQLKANMTISADLLGTGAVNTYNDRAGIVPAQQINFRDLLPRVPSPTGSYVTYKETNTVQSLTTQTEGNAKTQIEYQFTGSAAVSKYISGFVRFSKQLMYAAPFLNNTLPRLLLRDFYKKENDYFFTTIAGNSTGTSLPAGTLAKADAEELIQVIASQRGKNFNASMGIIDWTEWSRLLTTKPNDYSIPGGVVIDAMGNIRVAGVPIIPASWAQTDHVLVLDRDFYEVAETEGLSVQFSFEDNDNFEKNLITARVECFEEINRLRDDASIYYDFGNS